MTEPEVVFDTDPLALQSRRQQATATLNAAGQPELPRAWDVAFGVDQAALNMPLLGRSHYSVYKQRCVFLLPFPSLPSVCSSYISQAGLELTT